MAKLALILLFITGCATQKKDEDYGLSIKMRDSLFAEQSFFASLKSSKDPFFLNYTPSKCLSGWSKRVEVLKQSLKKTVNSKERQNIWFELGNCNILVGDYKSALYYYDLVLGLNFKTKKINSAIYFNMGQIYENAEKDFLAYSYYQLAKDNFDKGRYSLFKLAVLEFEQAEYTISNKYFTELLRYYPQSEVIHFLLGVNYFHLGRKREAINKVLNKLDEKSVSRILLNMAFDIADSKNMENLEADLKNLDVNFKVHQDFKRYLLNTLER